MLIEEAKDALPDIKIIILEPFVLKGTATQGMWEQFSAEVKKNADSAKRVADRYLLSFVPLQNIFDVLSADGNTEYWSADGIHPTSAGHQVIKEELMKAISRFGGLDD